MQGFEMLLYGTSDDPLYDDDQQKWVVGSQGFKDALNFVKTVYSEKLGPTPQTPSTRTRLHASASELLPERQARHRARRLLALARTG